MGVPVIFQSLNHLAATSDCCWASVGRAHPARSGQVVSPLFAFFSVTPITSFEPASGMWLAHSDVAHTRSRQRRRGGGTGLTRKDMYLTGYVFDWISVGGGRRLLLVET